MITVAEVSQELTEDLQRSEVVSITRMLEWFEVTDREGVIGAIERATDTAIRDFPKMGRLSIQATVAYSLALGARLAKRGLL